MKPKRKKVVFNPDVIKIYHTHYFSNKSINDEDNTAIMLELLFLNNHIAYDEYPRNRILIRESSNTTQEFVFVFCEFVLKSFKKYEKLYYSAFENNCTKKIFWNDLVYKLKLFVEPKLDYSNVVNPYQNNFEFIF